MAATLSERLSESDHFRQIVTQVDVVIDQMMSRSYARYCPNDVWQPQVNVYESDSEVTVCVDLAGIRGEDIHVEAHADCLVLRGRRLPPAPPRQEADLRVHVMEIDAGNFSRQIELPVPVDRSRVSARYHEGLLWVVIPKANK